MDPDTATGQIAYDKGATFLRTIEQAVGREKWDAYLKAYFDRHAFQPQTSAGFLADLRANLFKNDAATAQKIGLDQWVYQPGIPANAVHVTSTAFVPIDKAAAAFAATGDIAQAPRGVSTQEILRFINQLPRGIGHAKLATLDTARSEEHTSELQSLMRISYAVFCLKKKNKNKSYHNITHTQPNNNKN